MIDTILRQAQRMGAPRAIAVCQSINGTLEFQAGHWSEAEATLHESLQLNRELGTAFGEAIACQRLGVLLTVQGRLDEGLEILEEGLVAAEHGIGRSHALTRLYAAMARNRLAAGDLAAADRALTLGLSIIQNHGHCNTCESLLLPAAVSIRVAQEDLAGAEAFAGQLDEAAARYGSRTWLALASQAQGQLAEANDDLEVAMDRYRQAQASFEAAGNEAEAGQCREALAQLQQL